MDQFDNMSLATAADNDAIQALLSDEPVSAPVPIIDSPGNDQIALIVGRTHPDTGKVSKRATVRELTGVHEERISRVDGMDIPAWSQVVLECGVTSIGDEKVTGDALKRLKVGDRDKLLVGIRQATFGNYIDLGDIQCDECEKTTHDAKVDTREIEEVPFSGEDIREIDLPSGRRARVSYPNGADQAAYMENASETLAERNSTLMSRCVEVIYEESGSLVVIAGDTSYVRNLGIRDREALVHAISDNPPGPRYNGVVVHLDCGHDTSASIGLMHLFPGLW